MTRAGLLRPLRSSMPTMSPLSRPPTSKPVLRLRPVSKQRRSYAGCACQAANQKRTAYVALGSNLGDRVAEIEKACNLMDSRGIRVKRTSSLWETEPMYVTDQDRFLNGACEVIYIRNLSSFSPAHSLIHHDANLPSRSRQSWSHWLSWTSSRKSRMTWADTKSLTRGLGTLIWIS